MSFSSSEEQTAVQAFLRTQSEPRHCQHRITDASSNTPQAAPAGQIFPLPDIKPKVSAQLAPYNRFVSMAIAIDASVGQGQTSDVPSPVKNGLNAVQKDCGGFWFAWQHNLCGYALPDHDAASAQTIAQEMINSLTQTSLERITIGLSQFPQNDNDRSNALQNACKALNHAAFFGPGNIVVFDSVSLNISGDLYYQAKDLYAAMTEYRAALVMDPENTNVHNSLGVCLAQLEEYEAARHAFAEALRLDANEAMAAYNLGVLDLLAHKPEQALGHFYKAYANDTQTAEIPLQIGKVLTERKQYGEAIKYLKAAIALYPSCAPAYTQLGRCQASSGQTREAINSYKKAVKINPNDATALSSLGALYDAKGENRDICLTFCKQSVALSPDNGLFRLRLARLYHKYQHFDHALSEYEAATALGYNAEKQIAQIQEQLETTDNDKQCCA